MDQNFLIMINTITTIQEITLQAYDFGIYRRLQDEKDMSRDQIFNLFEEWGKEFDKKHEGYEWNGDYYNEIDTFIMAKNDAL